MKKISYKKLYNFYYSHSIVEGGLLIISQKTLLTLGTLFIISVATSDKIDTSIFVTSAIIASTEFIHPRTFISYKKFKCI